MPRGDQQPFSPFNIRHHMDRLNVDSLRAMLDFKNCQIPVLPVTSGPGELGIKAIVTARI